LIHAGRLGFDFGRMRADALAVRGKFWAASGMEIYGHWRDECAEVLERHPGIADLFQLKSLLVAEFLEACRSAAEPDKKIAPIAFPLPWTAVSGFDYGPAAPHCDSILLKLVPSHWPIMLRAYGEAIACASPDISEPPWSPP
jgi:hypothetical protein